MRITPAFSLLLPLTLLASAGCGIQPGMFADNRQDVIISPIAFTGGLELNLASAGFQAQATVADVALLSFEISSPVLSGPRVQTFDKKNLPADGRVKFQELPPGNYTISSVAKDAAGKTIGAKSASATVEAGKTAVVKLSIKLAQTEITNPNGNLYIDFEMIDGDVIVKPIEEPSPAPSPTPTPSASPSPNPNAGSLGLYNLADQKLSSGLFESKGTVYNSADVSLTGEIKAEFKAYKGIFVRELKVVETKTFPLVIGAKATYNFTLTSTEKADAVSVSVSVK